MLNIFICEDNKEHLEKIQKIISNTLLIEDLDMKISLSTSDPYDILDYIKDNKSTSLYFLDVDLKSSINGIQLAEKIREYDPRGFIVFVTTHAEMSYLTFLYKVEAIDYIIKDNYDSMSIRIKECILNAYKKYTALTNTAQKVFTVKNGDRILTIDLDNIILFETSSSVHKINLYTENKVIEFYGKIKDLCSLLDDRFYRCHQSYIVNKDKIKEIDKRERIIHMIDGSQCTVSIRYMKALL